MGVLVAVAVGVLVGVLVTVDVGVFVGVLVAVAVGVSVGVWVAVAVGLGIFGFAFAVNSSVHSYLILAYAGSEKAAEDVGFGTNGHSLLIGSGVFMGHHFIHDVLKNNIAPGVVAVVVGVDQ